MKKLCSILLVLSMLLTLAACESAEDKWQAKYEQAQTLLEQKDYAGACEAFDALADLDPENVLAYLGKAEAKISAGENPVEELEQVLKRDPENVQALHYRAEAALLQEDLKTAEEIYQKLLTLEPDNDAGWNFLALQEENLQKKAELLRDGLQKTGGSSLLAETCFRTAEAFWDEEDTENASRFVDILLETVPENPLSYVGRAEVLYSGEDWKDQLEAIEADLQRALELDPGCIPALESLSLSPIRDINMGREGHALEELKELTAQILALDPENTEALHNQEVIFYHTQPDGIEQLEAWQTKRLEENPGDEWALLSKVNLIIERGEFDQAEGAIQEALKIAETTDALEEKLRQVRQGHFEDYMGRSRKETGFDPEGNVVWWRITTYGGGGETTVSYDAEGRETGRGQMGFYSEDGKKWKQYSIEMDTGRIAQQAICEVDEKGVNIQTYYDALTGRKTEEHRYWEDENGVSFFEVYQANGQKHYASESYPMDEDNISYGISRYYRNGAVTDTEFHRDQYDDLGRQIRSEDGDILPDGTEKRNSITEYEYEGDSWEVSIERQYDGEGNLDQTITY